MWICLYNVCFVCIAYSTLTWCTLCSCTSNHHRGMLGHDVILTTLHNLNVLSMCCKNKLYLFEFCNKLSSQDLGKSLLTWRWFSLQCDQITLYHLNMLSTCCRKDVHKPIVNTCFQCSSSMGPIDINQYEPQSLLEIYLTTTLLIY